MKDDDRQKAIKSAEVHALSEMLTSNQFQSYKMYVSVEIADRNFDIQQVFSHPHLNRVATGNGKVWRRIVRNFRFLDFIKLLMTRTASCSACLLKAARMFSALDSSAWTNLDASLGSRGVVCLDVMLISSWVMGLADCANEMKSVHPWWTGLEVTNRERLWSGCPGFPSAFLVTS